MMVRSGFNTGFLAGFSAVVDGFLNMAQAFFARYFNAPSIFAYIGGIWTMLDTANDQTRTAGLTTVVDTDFTSEIWIDSAELAFTPHFTGVTDNNTGVHLNAVYQTNQTVNGVGSRNGYRITLPASVNVSNIKLWNADLLGELGKLGVEIIEHPIDFVTNWVVAGDGVIIDSDSFRTGDGSGIGGVVRNNIIVEYNGYYLTVSGDADSILECRQSESSGSNHVANSIGVGFGSFAFSSLAEKTAVYLRQTIAGTTNISNFSIKEILLTQSEITSLDTNTSALVSQWLLNEGAGTNNDNIIVLDRIDGKHGELVNATLPSAWTEVFDRSDPSNTDGYNIALIPDGNDDYIDTGVLCSALNDWKLIAYLMPVSIMSSQSIWGSSDTLFFVRLIGGNDIRINIGGFSETTEFVLTDFIDFTTQNVKLEIEWKASTKLLTVTANDSVSDSKTLSGASTGENRNFSLFARNNTIELYRDTFLKAEMYYNDVKVRELIPQFDGTLLDTVNNVTYTNQGTGDLGTLKIPASTSSLDIFGNALTFSGQAGYHSKTYAQALKGDGVAYLAFANLPAYDAITVIEDGTEVSISLSSGNWTPTSGKYYKDIRFTLLGTEVEHFPLSQYAPDSSPASVIFDGKYDNSATATLTNGTLGAGGNLSQMEGLADINLNGFNPAVISDGVDDYIAINNVLLGDNFEIRLVGRFLSSNPDFAKLFGNPNSEGYIGIEKGNISTEADFYFYPNGASSRAGLEIPQMFDGSYKDILITYNSGVVVIKNYGVQIASNTFNNFNGFNIAKNYTLFRSTSYSKCELANFRINDLTFLPQTDGTIKDSNGVTYTNQGTGSLGVKYIPASAITSGKDIAGLDLKYPAGTSKLLKASWQQNYELIQKDADNVLFDVSGNPIEIDMDTLADNDYIDVTRDSDGNITDLKIN